MNDRTGSDVLAYQQHRIALARHNERPGATVHLAGDNYDLAFAGLFLRESTVLAIGMARGQPPQAERHELEHCYRCCARRSEERGLDRLLAPERSMTASKDHVVSGLIEKRRELAGIIDELQRQLDQHRADLTHIDGVLRVLATDIDPETIRPKRAYRRNRYFARNELSRLCLGVLRTAAGELLSTDEIAGRVIATKGFDSGDAILRAAIREQVGSTVKRLHREGTIENIGARRASRWKLASA